MIKVFKSEKAKEQVMKSYNHLLELWGTEIEEIDLKTRWGTTHCILAGDRANPPLLLLHGVGDNSAVMWVLNIKELSKHFFCIAIDTLGGPGKSVPNENFNKKSFKQADWINEIVERLQISNFNIAGVSNGATMAFNYAVRESKKINKVVCMEGGMVIKPFKAILNTILLLFPEILIPNKKNMIKIMQKLASPQSRIFIDHLEVVDHMIMVLKSHDQGAMLVHNLEKYDKAKAAAVRDKIYFLIGGFKVEHKKDFIDILEDGGFKYKVIENAGHGVNHDQPEEVNKELISFLSNQLPYACPAAEQERNEA